MSSSDPKSPSPSAAARTSPPASRSPTPTHPPSFLDTPSPRLLEERGPVAHERRRRQVGVRVPGQHPPSVRQRSRVPPSIGGGFGIDQAGAAPAGHPAVDPTADQPVARATLGTERPEEGGR